MKRIKKIFAAIMIFIILSAMLTFGCFAAEPDYTSNDDETTEITVWDRVKEYIMGDKLSQSVTFAYNIFCTILLILMKRSTTTSSKDLFKIVTASDTSVKSKLNELADIYNANEEEVKALKLEIENFRNEHKIKTVTAEQFEAVEEGVRGIAEMLQTVYQNSSTIPAAVKEIVAKKYNVLNDAIDKAEESVRKEV